jgi:hypothetical protein
MVARFQRLHARPAFHHHARAFMPEDRGEDAFGIGAGQGEFVGVADAGGLDLDQNLAFLGVVEIDFHDLQWLSGGNGDSGTSAHLVFLP